MKLIHTAQLDARQKNEIEKLITACRKYRPTGISFPFDDASVFCLLYDPSLVCALALSLPSDPEIPAECTAFTLPGRRGEGLFTSAMDSISDRIDDYDLLFPADHRDPDTLLALSAMGAERISDEYMMECELSGKDFSSLPNLPLPITENNTHIFIDETSDAEGTVTLTFNLFAGSPRKQSPDALCRTALFHQSERACFYDFSVKKELRRQGIGQKLLLHVLLLLHRRGVSSVFLHVSGSNTAAVSLYKKTGFQITVTLSYYLY